MPVVFEDLDLPSGGGPGAVIDITLVGAGRRPVAGYQASANKKIVGTTRLRSGDGIDPTGLWSVPLPSNADIEPANTTWLVKRDLGCATFESFISVPATGGPFAAFQLEVDPVNQIAPAALASHAADRSLHGGGQTLFFIELTTNVGPVTGTGFADIPGLVGTLTVPDRPYVIEAVLPMLIEENGQFAEARIVFGGGPTRLTMNRLRAGQANEEGKLFLKARVPTGALHAPAPGSVVTYKVQWRSSVSTNEISVFNQFGSQIDVCQFWAETA